MRMTYDETMRYGEQQYRDALDALNEAGIPAYFTQTGGMNAALEAVLDGGARLLVTDSDDSLSWSRADQEGWGVGLYRDAESQDCLSFDLTSSVDLAALVSLVRSVLRDASRQARKRLIRGTAHWAAWVMFP